MIKIRELQPDDLPRTVELHRKHLRLGLFPRLGRRFLREYHLSFARSPHAVALVAQSEGGLEGAIFGTTSNGEHYRWVVRNHWQALAWHGVRSLLLQPSLAWSFLTTRIGRYAKGLARHAGARKDGAPTPRGNGRPVAVLSHVVTASGARQRGVGRRLVERFRQVAGSGGARRARLITREGGPGVPFFERVGGQCVARRLEPDGAEIREYILPLAGNAPDEGMPDIPARGRIRRLRAGGGGAVAARERPADAPRE